MHNEINANLRHVADKEVTGRRSSPRLAVKLHTKLEDSHLIDNPLYSDHPPPLPPRVPLSAPVIGNEQDAVNSINKQMSYPLVATCATLVNDDVSNMLFKQWLYKYIFKSTYFFKTYKISTSSELFN